MIISRPLTQMKDFVSIKKWDWLAIEFKESYSERFRIYQVIEHKEIDHEIVLERKKNIYFSYERFLNGWWAAKNITLISHCYVQKVDLKYVVTRISDGKTREYDSLLEALTFCRTSFFLYYIKWIPRN